MIINARVIILLLLPLSTQAGNTKIINTERSETYYITKKPKQVAAPTRQSSPLVTAECSGSFGGDVRGQFFGISFFRSTEVKPCDCRENAKVYKWLGEHRKAIQAMDVCQLKKTRRCFIFFKCKKDVEENEKNQ